MNEEKNETAHITHGFGTTKRCDLDILANIEKKNYT